MYLGLANLGMGNLDSGASDPENRETCNKK